ncbi:Flp family type IVb pilin [Geomonas oryzisoli]|uniref:Flp family type IVb pilin n=1 Tax=Geomonas oryzisoli TaxID=2847992 RepID=A0ABX8JDD7_9BACT|nr:Flp family type IVb pilin [Geomonas oryzisoli]QWV95101.1 Flp family type IVb pilin [Geomonas oryzisoli]
MSKLKKLLISLWSKLGGCKGQGLVEYALLLVLITMVVFAMLVAFGQRVNNTYEIVNSSVQGAGM